LHPRSSTYLPLSPPVTFPVVRFFLVRSFSVAAESIRHTLYIAIDLGLHRLSSPIPMRRHWRVVVNLQRTPATTICSREAGRRRLRGSEAAAGRGHLRLSLHALRAPATAPGLPQVGWSGTPVSSSCLVQMVSWPLPASPPLSCRPHPRLSHRQDTAQNSRIRGWI
jgi:hypothetical protein